MIKGRWSLMDKTALSQNRKRQKKRIELKKGKTEKEEIRERRHVKGRAKKECVRPRVVVRG